MVLADIAVMPLRPYGCEDEMYRVVDECIRLIKDSGLRYEIGANSTTVQGDLDKVFDLAKRVHLVPFDLGCERVITIFRIDQKKGGLSIDEKLKNQR
nr:thiamine-binding protein [uncultured Peptostreptococcus sp.]